MTKSLSAVTEPLPLEELRNLARKNGGVNVHLATYYELRWHDPYFINAFERWGSARSLWDKTWPNVDISAFGDDYPFNPDPEKIPQPIADIAREYLNARKAFLEAGRRYYTND